MITPQAQILNSLNLKNYYNVYYIGTEFRGITIYKQQVRALNLIHSLQKEKVLFPGKRVGIIGGGIGGISTSAACLSIGCNVILYENKPLLLHLQTGCKTRWVHPNIYDWPEPGSDFPYAGLPLLNWKEGYSADVVQELLSSYQEITKRYRSLYTECLSVKFKSVDLSKLKINHDDCSNPEFKRHDSKFDVIILATGFGLETGVLNSESEMAQSVNSYWRNDDIDQPYIGESNSFKRNIVISGTGDGACIDLLRSTIKNYHQGRFITDLFSACTELGKLKTTILNIKADADSNKSRQTYLYEQLTEIDKDIVSGIKHYVKTQLREDTHVTLLGQYNDLSEIFTVEKMSIFNAFAVYILHTIGGFDYFGYKTPITYKTKKGSNKAIRIDLLVAHNGYKEIFLPFDALIFRHGPLKGIKTALQTLGVNDAKIDDSKYTSNRVFEAGWPFIQSATSKGIEFVPPLSKAVSTTFIEILGETLLYFHKIKNPRFRLVLDRFIKINDEVYFQQTSRYGGTATFDPKKKIGRIFPAEYGLVGYCANRQEAVLLVREPDFDDAVAFLDTKKLMASPISANLNSMFCLPIFVKGENGTHLVSLILYIDSSEKDFFSDTVIEVIIKACQGFIKNLDRMVESKDVKVTYSSFNGLQPDPTLAPTGNFESLRSGVDISSHLENLKLSFNLVSSLDLYE